MSQLSYGEFSSKTGQLRGMLRGSNFRSSPSEQLPIVRARFAGLVPRPQDDAKLVIGRRRKRLPHEQGKLRVEDCHPVRLQFLGFGPWV